MRYKVTISLVRKVNFFACTNLISFYQVEVVFHIKYIIENQVNNIV